VLTRRVLHLRQVFNSEPHILQLRFLEEARAVFHLLRLHVDGEDRSRGRTLRAVVGVLPEAGPRVEDPERL
jgi:hypothetical protein